MEKPLLGGPSKWMMDTPVVPPGKASFVGSTLNIMTRFSRLCQFASQKALTCSFSLESVIGSGILTVPWALSQSSLVYGVSLLCLICGINVASFVSLASCCERTGTYSYLGMGTNILGRKAGLFLQSVVLCHTFFSCVSYMVFIGSILPDGIKGIATVGISDDLLRTVSLIGTGVLVLPLCLTKNLDPLRYSSGLAVAGVLYTSVCVIYRLGHPYEDDASTPTLAPTPQGEINWTSVSVRTLLTIQIIQPVTFYSCIFF